MESVGHWIGTFAWWNLQSSSNHGGKTWDPNG